MQSPDNTVISLPDEEITDAAGNVWTIVNGQVAVNGQIDPTTANVIEMAYENGVVWQKNTSDLWWSKTSPSAQWSPTSGTSVDPIPNQQASQNDSILIAKPSGTIVDPQGNQWTISNSQVLINGVMDATTARVVQLVNSGGQVWQENADGLWWSKSSPAASWEPTYGTPTPPVPDPDATVNDVTMNSNNAPLMDASGNQWAITDGQVTVNGIVDPATKNVVELAYVNGRVWQENADGLWWSKTTPADQWSPAYGTSQSPVSTITRFWDGQDAPFSNGDAWTPNGVPQAGDTAVIGSGTVTVGAGYGAGVDFTLTGGDAEFTYGTYGIGALRGTGAVQIGGAGSSATLQTSGVRLDGNTLQVNDLAAAGGHGTFVVDGYSSITKGSTLTVGETGAASLPLGTIQNNNTIQLADASTLNVGTLDGNNGTVVLTEDSNLTVEVAAASSETIELQTGHLEIGGYPQSTTSPAMQFLAPITDFGSDSTITLDNAQATAELFKQSSPTAGELFLYNGSAVVADLNISGQSQVYASYDPTSNAVTITAQNNGHALPVYGQAG